MKLLKFHFFPEEVSSRVKEDVTVLATEILAQFSEGSLEEKLVYLDLACHLPDSPFWVYRR